MQKKNINLGEFLPTDFRKIANILCDQLLKHEQLLSTIPMYENMLQFARDITVMFLDANTIELIRSYTLYTYMIWDYFCNNEYASTLREEWTLNCENCFKLYVSAVIMDARLKGELPALEALVILKQ